MKNTGRNQNYHTGLFFLIILGLVLVQCSKDEKMVPFTESEVIRLLSGDTTKSWLRTTFQLNGADQDLDDCGLYTVTTFYLGTSDSLKYTVVTSPDFCQSQTDTLECGDWGILGQEENQNIADKIQLISEGDTTHYQIDQITSLYLNLSQTVEDLLYHSRFEAILPE